ncbi:MAG TPA: hypothetical protein VGE79_09765, partial [Niastella sp.]
MRLFILNNLSRQYFFFQDSIISLISCGSYKKACGEIDLSLMPICNMRKYLSNTTIVIGIIIIVVTASQFIQCKTTKVNKRTSTDISGQPDDFNDAIERNSKELFEKGKAVFRFETFGDEVFWTDQLQLHKAIADSKHGGTGKGLSPKEALAAGLKVDLAILPKGLRNQIREGKFLDDPWITLRLIRLNAVLGVVGKFDDDGNLKSIGLTCASCHSTVEHHSGIGKRLDGWPNRDLNVGALISMSPDLTPIAKLLDVDVATVKKVLASWGPGKFDAELNLDGKAFRPDGKSGATLIPEAFGHAGHNLHTWTGGWGNVTYWNAYVANLELAGQGNFYDPRLMDAKQYPIAAKAGFGNKRSDTDLVSSKLAALQFYQLAIPPPKAPKGSYNEEGAKRGEILFSGKAKCASCHVP